MKGQSMKVLPMRPPTTNHPRSTHQQTQPLDRQSPANARVHIIIIAKEPRPGFAKTRLIPALGVEGAAILADRLLRHTLTEALAADTGSVELCVTPDPDASYWQDLEALRNFQLSAQADGDLGARLAAAAQRAMTGKTPVILIGSDCPALDRHQLQQMAKALQTEDACLCPVADGGYALLGLQRFAASLFTDIPWSTDQVAALTRQRLQQLGWSWYESAPLRDIDEPEDLPPLETDYPALLTDLDVRSHS